MHKIVFHSTKFLYQNVCDFHLTFIIGVCDFISTSFCNWIVIYWEYK
jgi:hypothetical protein